MNMKHNPRATKAYYEAQRYRMKGNLPASIKYFEKALAEFEKCQVLSALEEGRYRNCYRVLACVKSATAFGNVVWDNQFSMPEKFPDKFREYN